MQGRHGAAYKRDQRKETDRLNVDTNKEDVVE